MYRSFFLEENSLDRHPQLEEEPPTLIASIPEDLPLGVIAGVHHLRALEAPVMVDIAHLLHQGEGPPQEGTHHDPVRGIATSTPTDRDPAHGQGLRGRDHDRYHRDLGVGPRCEGIEEYHDGTCCHLRGEEGGGEVPAIRVFPATVIEAAVEADADMEGLKDDGCMIWSIC